MEELTLAAKDFHKLESSKTKSGFRDGLSEGHQSNLQLSFEQGFSNGVKERIRIGQLLGRLNALKASYEKQSRCVDKVIELVEQVENLKSDSLFSDKVKDHFSLEQTETDQSVKGLVTCEDPPLLAELIVKYESLLNES